MLVRMWTNRGSQTLLLGMEICTSPVTTLTIYTLKYSTEGPPHTFGLSAQNNTFHTPMQYTHMLTKTVLALSVCDTV